MPGGAALGESLPRGLHFGKELRARVAEVDDADRAIVGGGAPVGPGRRDGPYCPRLVGDVIVWSGMGCGILELCVSETLSLW